MSREPYDSQQHQIAVLEGIEEQLKRIADALEAAVTPTITFTGPFASHPSQKEPES